MFFHFSVVLFGWKWFRGSTWFHSHCFAPIACELLCVWLQVEYEGLKHEIKVQEEEAELLNTQLQEVVRLKDISDGHLEEALESLKSEREQKKHLRRELLQHLSVCDVAYTGSAHLVFSSAPPSGSATPTAVLSPGAEQPTRCILTHCVQRSQYSFIFKI